MSRKHPEHPEIIYRPDLQPAGRRALFSAITLFAWLVWLYLFLPLLSIAAWWFGITTFQEQMLDPVRNAYLFTLTGYAIVVAIATLLIVGWSRYNEARFGGPDRRRPVAPVTDEMIQERFGLDAATIRQVRKAQIMQIELDRSGRLERADFEPVRPRPVNADT